MNISDMTINDLKGLFNDSVSEFDKKILAAKLNKTNEQAKEKNELLKKLKLENEINLQKLHIISEEIIIAEFYRPINKVMTTEFDIYLHEKPIAVEHTFDKAILMALVCKYDGINSHAGEYITKMINM